MIAWAPQAPRPRQRISVMDYGDLVDRLLNPGLAAARDRQRRQAPERRAQGSRRADGDDNPGWAGHGMHWTPSGPAVTGSHP